MLYKNDMLDDLLDENTSNDILFPTLFDTYSDNDQSSEHILRFIFKTPVRESTAVKYLVEDAARNNSTETNCFHDHDCCGCWFSAGLHVHVVKSPLEALTKFGEDIYQYTVYVNWSSYRNV